MKSSELVAYLDQLLEIPDHPDFSGAWNGVQVELPEEINVIGTAVDACAETAALAAAKDCDLLIVHHGMLWGGARRFTGDLYAQLQRYIQARCGVYSAHLPLDGHSEFGNNAILATKLALGDLRPFGEFKGAAIGRIGNCAPMSTEDASEKLGYDVIEAVAPASPVTRLAVVSGSAGSTLREAQAQGAQVLLTGEVDHHCRVEARDIGMGIWTGGHYKTETHGVEALGRHLADKFGLQVYFLEAPTGG